jgi:Cu+-exporting ATPase
MQGIRHNRMANARISGSPAVLSSDSPGPLSTIVTLAVCPGCGCEVDPLRAGHVAVLEGRFRYFCRPECKRAYLVSEVGAQEDVPTARPPEVEAMSAATNGHASSRDTRANTPPGSFRVATLEAMARETPVRPFAPPTLSPPTPREDFADAAEADVAPGPRAGGRALALVDAVGIALGALVPAIALAGSLGDVLRLPLAVSAFACLAVRCALSRPDRADPHPLVVLAPAAGSIGAACWARAMHDPRFVAIVVLAGLTSAAGLVVEGLVDRLRRVVVAGRERIERALDLQARVVQGGEIIPVRATDVRPGEQLVVDQGETVGVDATVIAGEAIVSPWLDARSESLKREGDAVVAGAKVLRGSLRMTATWSGRDRAWLKLIGSSATRVDVVASTPSLVRHVVERGAPIAAVLVGVAAFAANATPVEILATMAAGATAFGGKALGSLVALHYARAHLEALRSGITYKDARAFERAAAANVAVLSARGTVLMGEPELVAVESVGSFEVERVLSLAAGAETASSHPFAAAVLRAARVRQVTPDHVRNATVHAGLGVTASASTGERLIVGGRAIMLAEKVGVAMADTRVSELEGQGHSVLLVALGDRPVGLIALQDGLRPGARAAVQKLLDSRIEPVLLSGEARETCETIGRALDVEHIRPEVLPADRGAEVRALAEGGGVVAAIGHPAQDDGALGAADVAVAMGAAGATPGEWAVTVAGDDVREAALSLAIPHAARDRARVAMVLGATPGLLALLAIGFGVAPLALAPIAALIGAVAVAVHGRSSDG